ncbi:hypothetical protein [Bradyrhizobium sp. F1.4.3]|uniref:hypothetical protein n=1 Tax=Bradyrhizobium sp. F1.4.3 TaxID=3156356 RepID=UPI0033926EC0
MPVLNRAELSRTGVIFVALLLAICATGAVAREFRAADTQAEDYPTVQALRYMGAMIAERTGGRHEIKVFRFGAEPVELPYGQVLMGLATRLIDGAENNRPSFVTTDDYQYDIDRKPFEDAMAAVYAKAARDPAAAALIERIRKVE